MNDSVNVSPSPGRFDAQLLEANAIGELPQSSVPPPASVGTVKSNMKVSAATPVTLARRTPQRCHLDDDDVGAAGRRDAQRVVGLADALVGRDQDVDSLCRKG